MRLSDLAPGNTLVRINPDRTLTLATVQYDTGKVLEGVIEYSPGDVIFANGTMILDVADPVYVYEKERTVDEFLEDSLVMQDNNRVGG